MYLHTPLPKCPMPQLHAWAPPFAQCCWQRARPQKSVLELLALRLMLNRCPLTVNRWGAQPGNSNILYVCLQHTLHCGWPSTKRSPPATACNNSNNNTMPITAGSCLQHACRTMVLGWPQLAQQQHCGGSAVQEEQLVALTSCVHLLLTTSRCRTQPQAPVSARCPSPPDQPAGIAPWQETPPQS